MRELSLRILAKKETRERYAFIDAALEAFFDHPCCKIGSRHGFGFDLMKIIRNLQDADIYEFEDIWLMLDMMFRDDLSALTQLQVHKIILDPNMDGLRKMRHIRTILAAPEIPYPLASNANQVAGENCHG